MALKNATRSLLRAFRDSPLASCPYRLAGTAQSDAQRLRERAVNLSYVSYESHVEKGEGTDAAGSPIIIMHGLLGSKANWNSLAKQIHQKTRRKIIAVDARNHGDSPHAPDMDYYLIAEDVVKLMDDLAIPKATLVGHSMGGRAMMLLALTKPDLTDGAIFVETSPVRLPNANATDFYLDRVQYIRLQPYQTVAEAKIEAYLQMVDLGIKPSYADGLFVLDVSPTARSGEAVNLIGSYLNKLAQVDIPQHHDSLALARNAVDSQLLHSVPEPMVRQFLLTNLVQDNSTGSFRWRMNLKSLARNFQPHLATFPAVDDSYKGPTYFIGGGRSEYLKKEDHGAILKYFPRAEFHYIADAGHWIHSEKPQQFLEIFLDCLGKARKSDS